MVTRIVMALSLLIACNAAIAGNFEDQYTAGTCLFEKKAYTKALEVFQSLTNQQSTNPEYPAKTRLMIGKCRYYLNEIDGAMLDFRMVATNYSSGNGTAKEPVVEAIRWLGDGYFLKKEYSSARVEYMKLNQSGATNYSAYGLYQLGRCHAGLSEATKARESFQQVMDKYPSSPWAKQAQYQMRKLDK